MVTSRRFSHKAVLTPSNLCGQAEYLHDRNAAIWYTKWLQLCAGSSKFGAYQVFSKKNNMLCFLAVVPVYRRQHIARQMVSFMLTLMKDGEDITITAS